MRFADSAFLFVASIKGEAVSSFNAAFLSPSRQSAGTFPYLQRSVSSGLCPAHLQTNQIAPIERRPELLGGKIPARKELGAEIGNSYKTPVIPGFFKSRINPERVAGDR
jgi:hypothetical protein